MRTIGPIEKGGLARRGLSRRSTGPSRFAAQTRQMLMPVLQRNPAFSGGDAPGRIMLPDAIAKERLFEPA